MQGAGPERSEREDTGAPSLTVEFCDEWTEVPAGQAFVIGRDGDLVLDDNPYLHRRFLQIRQADGLWWLSNTGSQLTATLSDPSGSFSGRLAPGASLPVVFDVTRVRVAAGSTAYELSLHLDRAPFSAVDADEEPVDGTLTLGRPRFTDDQLLLIVALAEPLLRDPSVGLSAIPSSAVAAERLGWTLTKFNRKLDNVCQRLSKSGVPGLHGRADRLASNRRARLVEHAVAVGIVRPDHLDRLDRPDAADDADS
jgi:hypothetical protein